MSNDINEIPSMSPNFRTELAEQLAELVPEAIADGKVDVAKLKELLDEDYRDESERFGLFWPGKKRALRAAQEPTTATLKPVPSESKNWDTTQNVYIEGDNLEILKILQKHYHNKIKMIYIDPPYNTGKDFIYPDNYIEGLSSYLEFTRQVDEEGRALRTNSETEGRYHSNWLNMMYPRLKLARNLLTDDGVIFVSIDDQEVTHLRKLCDELFGESNFVGQFTWVTKNAARGVPPRTMLMENHEYVVAYARKIENVKFRGLDRDEEDFSNPDGDPRGLWRSESMKATGAQDNYFTMINPENGHEFYANWAFSKVRVAEMITQRLVIFPAGKDGTPRQKKFLDSYLNDKKAFVTNLGWYSTENATKALMNMFDGKKIFDFPKPVELVKFFVNQATTDDILLDFFSGSGTSAHAVMQLNSEDGGNRRFILVQLPEPTSDGSEARKAGFQTISAIGRKRIDLAGEKIQADLDRQLMSRESPLDIGYRTYTLVDTNFPKWKVGSDVGDADLRQELLGLGKADNGDSSSDDILIELLLKQGYSLTEEICHLDVDGLNVRSVGDNLLLACLDTHIKPTLEQLRVLAEIGPAKFVVLDDVFQGDDELKTNLVQICKSKDIELWTA